MNKEFQPLDSISDSHHFHAGISDSVSMFPESDRGTVGNPPEHLDLETWENITPTQAPSSSRLSAKQGFRPKLEWADQYRITFKSY